MTVLDNYRHLRHRSYVLRESICSCDLGKGEMSGEIYRVFGGLLVQYFPSGSCIWEPFSLPEGRGLSFFDETDITLVPQSLVSVHECVIEGDSTVQGPPEWCKPLGGVIFHPPYFGSNRQSDSLDDLSNIEGEEEYLERLQSAADIVVENLAPKGIVCAVGRRYRYGGKEIKLDEWFIKVFCEKLDLFEVWQSPPDVAILMKKD